MADKVRRVDYFYVTVNDKPGEGARILGKLKDVNFLSFTAFPVSGGRAKLTLIPEKTDAFLAATKRAGIDVSAKKECFLVHGQDRAGAVCEALSLLAESRVNCVASNGASAPGGGYSLVVFVKPADLGAAARAFGI